MPLTPHKEIAADVVQFIDDNWSNKPAGTTVSRAGSFEAALKTVEDDAGSRVVVIVPRVNAVFGSRGSDEIDVPVYVCVIAGVPGLEADDVDAWDGRAWEVRQVLADRALKKLSLLSGTIEATRRGTVSIPTTADADMLYTSEIFFGVLEMRYTFSVDVPEVSP